MEVDEVSDGFSGGAEERGAFSPAHGEGEKEGTEGGFAQAGQEGDAKQRDVSRLNRNTIETIGQVHFGKVGGTILGLAERRWWRVQSRAQLNCKASGGSPWSALGLTPEKV